MDVLADVLAATRFGNTTLCTKTFFSPWNLHFPQQRQATFHVVSRGSCWLMHEGDRPPTQLNQGDVALLAHGAGHALGDDPDLPLERWNPVVETGTPNSDYDAGTTLFCGAYRFADADSHPLLSLLPPVIHIAAAQARGDHALQSIVGLLMTEAGRPTHGSSAVVTRLMDVAFVYIVRSWLSEQPERTVGWLSALRDPQIGSALAAIHERPAMPWTVSDLAVKVHMSRAAFAKRFLALVGVAPLAYLIRWRMDLAARLLQDTVESVGSIAERVGYASETSFSKTFRRYRGQPPGRFRRLHNQRELVIQA